MLLPQFRAEFVDRYRRARREHLRRLGREEEGGIIVMSIILLLVMLILGGMAVDFMRFESERAQLQSVTDRAVLAAADLDQDVEPDVLVKDFFRAAGFEGKIVGDPIINDDNGTSRSVRVDSRIDVNTYYLRLLGIDELSAPAVSSAIEGTGNIEVSLVLDISGSMGNWVSSESATKMALLQDAATSFVDDLLLPQYEDRISINLVMYSQQVAIDDEFYKALNTTPDTIADTEPPITWSSFDGVTTPPPGVEYYTNPARCIDFLPAEYNTLAFNTARTYEQVEQLDMFSGSSQKEPDKPICPQDPAEQAILMSQDADVLKNAINNLRPTSWTSTHLGVKWGISLLDPSTRPIMAGLNSVDPEFKGRRPADYGDTNTIKYLVVMTDGQNVSSRRVEAEHYNTYDWRKLWAENTWSYYRNNMNGMGRNAITDPEYSANQYDTWMQQMCDLADDHMTIFTIAMGAGSHGTQEMAECASQPAFAFSTNLTGADGEPGIDEIFESIAEQITALRLNL